MENYLEPIWYAVANTLPRDAAAVRRLPKPLSTNPYLHANDNSVMIKNQWISGLYR